MRCANDTTSSFSMCRSRRSRCIAICWRRPISGFWSWSRAWSACGTSCGMTTLPPELSRTRKPRRRLLLLNRLGLPGGLTRRQVEEGLKRKVDLVLPDLPRQLRQRRNLGEPAIVTTTGFRKAIAELARSVAGAGLLDSLAAPAPAEPDPKRRLVWPAWTQ